MEKHHKFSIWYVLIGIWAVLLLQDYLFKSLSVKTIPYSVSHSPQRRKGI